MLTILLSFLIWLTSTVPAMAIPVKLRFEVLDDKGEPIKETWVTVYRNNQVIYQHFYKRSTIRLTLVDWNDDYYTLEVKKDDYLVKRVGFRTDMTDNELEMILDNRFKFYIELERTSKYVHFEDPESFTDYPAVIMEFDSDEGVFDYKQTYWVSTKRDYARLKATLIRYKF